MLRERLLELQQMVGLPQLARLLSFSAEASEGQARHLARLADLPQLLQLEVVGVACVWAELLEQLLARFLREPIPLVCVSFCVWVQVPLVEVCRCRYSEGYRIHQPLNLLVWIDPGLL